MHQNKNAGFGHLDTLLEIATSQIPTIASHPPRSAKSAHTRYVSGGCLPAMPVCCSCVHRSQVDLRIRPGRWRLAGDEVSRMTLAKPAYPTPPTGDRR